MTFPEDPQGILAGLNPEQRTAATTVRGPVVILAGAGTGKTTTITHRIAYQVASGAFRAQSILAVTFTEKAAGELKSRLRDLGVEEVEARTFHSAALSQLSRLWEPNTGQALPDILPSKAPLISAMANALPPPHRFLARRELAGEIEWAKNRMIPSHRYLAELDDHQPPIPAELMDRVYSGYERRKRAMGRLDFEDMLAMAIRLFDEHPAAIRTLRSRFQAFTVDEYQDVNPLQAALLDRWLGDREEVCVVGDDYQTIYGFAGASPEHLLTFPERYPTAAVVRLEENYRSTLEVLAVANRLADRLGGFRKTLRPTRGSGPAPVVTPAPNAATEVERVVDEVRRLQSKGVPFEEMAILYRVNARSEPFEEALAGAGIPYQVRDGAFLRRPGPRSVLQRLRKATGGVVESVDLATSSVGYDPEAEHDSDEEVTRQADLGRLRALAREFSAARPGEGIDAFLVELGRRFSEEHTGRGVNLLTYHRAKGLEFEAVFLPRLLDGELPFRSGRSTTDPSEERRLLYVGITRSKRYVHLSWPQDARARPSPFIEEMDLPVGISRRGRVARPRIAVGSTGGNLFEKLKDWRRRRARSDGVPAYVVFHDATLVAISQRRPEDWADLAAIPGVGPAKLERYADEVLAIVARARPPSVSA